MRTEHIASSPLGVFGSMLLVGRAGTTALAMLLAVESLIDGRTITAVFAAIITANTALQIVFPHPYSDDSLGHLALGLDIVVPLAAVLATGDWQSPFVVCLMVPVAYAGIGRGFRDAGLIAAACIGVVWAAFSVHYRDDVDSYLAAGRLAIMLGLVAIITGYARRIVGSATDRSGLGPERLHALSDTNSLLHSLHRMTQSHPSSLNLHEVLDSTTAQMRSLMPFDSIAVLVFDDIDEVWNTLRKEGASIPASMMTSDLPAGLRIALDTERAVILDDLGDGGTTTIAPGSSDGLYATLTARGSVIGLLAIESRTPDVYDASHIELLSGMTTPMALSLDNARWFSRLRNVGADEERTRIARDLHDRLGQSLAYLGFELDRIVGRHGRGDDVAAALGQLREDVRGVTREVRDTLYDLRTDVTEERSLGAVVGDYARRVQDRSEIEIIVDAEADHRLALLPERELWRIAQEALTNIERHSEASEAHVTWTCDGERGQLEVVDNGIGFQLGRSGRSDSYGLAGMRERAARIGAILDVDARPGGGTTITCTIDPNDSRHDPTPSVMHQQRRTSDRTTGPSASTAPGETDGRELQAT